MTRILRFRHLVERNIVSNRTTLKRWINEGRFPKPIELGPNSLGWAEDEVEAVLAARRAQRDTSEEAA